MSDLRNKLVKLAYNKPELRGDLLPLLKEASLEEVRKIEIRSEYDRETQKLDMDMDFSGPDYGNEEVIQMLDAKGRFSVEDALALVEKTFSREGRKKPSKWGWRVRSSGKILTASAAKSEYDGTEKITIQMHFSDKVSYDLEQEIERRLSKPY